MSTGKSSSISPPSGGSGLPLGSCGRVFRLLMWAFLFFIPVRLPVVDVLPDLLAWLIALGALAVLPGGEGRRLRALVLLGLALSVGRVVAVRLTGSQAAFITLHGAGLFVAIGLTWQVCGLIERIAASTDYPNLKRQAVLGRPLFVVYGALFYLAILLMHHTRGQVGGVLGAAAMLFGCALILCFMMALMSGAARMCEAEAKATTEKEATPEASTQPPQNDGSH